MPKITKSRRFKHIKDHDKARKVAATKKAKKEEAGASSCPDSSCSHPGSSSSSVSGSAYLDFTDSSMSALASPDPSIMSPSPDFSISPTPPEFIPCVKSESITPEPSNQDLSLEFYAEDDKSFLLTSPPSSNLGVVTDDKFMTHIFKTECQDEATSSTASADLNTSACSIDNKFLLTEVIPRIELFLRKDCVCIADEDKVFVIFLSRSEDRVTQRQIACNINGDVSVRVHCQPCPFETFLENVSPPKPLSVETVTYFVDRLGEIVSGISSLEICTGVPDKRYKSFWNECAGRGVIDSNPYKECRYSETFRSPNCTWLLSPRKRRCFECTKLLPVLKRKYEMATKERPMIWK